MHRALFKIILPSLAIMFWFWFFYPFCDKPEGFDYFMYWILVGFPYGFKTVWIMLLPRKRSLAEIVFNAMIGGLLGGFIVIIKILKIVAEFIYLLCDMFTLKKFHN